ncbi:4'-phosphopantetheinyl transferase superfamily protein [Agromyces sp. Leaf222]|uniref:4'-phosphopantetheinyl transferase family protein n=1 Tax=Agromyces sp. Leaf222 TaxID=1735688 RepID=UPI0006FCA155|nr:4'-phosphopantetheinyl transferase superfamily protein [Agromyces sp. Leaf222]KQM82802.1 hypothetical protein ASE68_05595 [Agromyces sp. Leaf222]
MTGTGGPTALAPHDARGGTLGGADGLWWRSGDWTVELPAPLAGAPMASDGEARRLRLAARRSIGRAWARDLVHEHLGVRPEFAEQRPGEKPRLRGDPAVDVSIAHSGTSMLVAVGIGALVGADVETSPFEAFARPQLVRRMCSPEELAVFARIDDGPLRRRALARAWTLKEAVLKARGVGLAVDPRSVAIDAEAVLAAVEARSAEWGLEGPPEMSIVRFAASGRGGDGGGGRPEVVHPQD